MAPCTGAAGVESLQEELDLLGQIGPACRSHDGGDDECDRHGECDPGRDEKDGPHLDRLAVPAGESHHPLVAVCTI